MTLKFRFTAPTSDDKKSCSYFIVRGQAKMGRRSRKKTQKKISKQENRRSSRVNWEEARKESGERNRMKGITKWRRNQVKKIDVNAHTKENQRWLL